MAPHSGDWVGTAQKVWADSFLAKITGSGPLTRSEMTRRVWDYVKKNNLQDSKNRRMINADAIMKPIFNGRDQVSMFEMTKLVNQHVTKLPKDASDAARQEESLSDPSKIPPPVEVTGREGLVPYIERTAERIQDDLLEDVLPHNIVHFKEACRRHSDVLTRLSVGSVARVDALAHLLRVDEPEATP